MSKILNTVTGERIAAPSDHIPDLWHIAMSLKQPQQDLVLEAWHNAHFIRNQRDELKAIAADRLVRLFSAEAQRDELQNEVSNLQHDYSIVSAQCNELREALKNLEAELQFAFDDVPAGVDAWMAIARAAVAKREGSAK